MIHFLFLSDKSTLVFKLKLPSFPRTAASDRRASDQTLVRRFRRRLKNIFFGQLILSSWMKKVA